MPRELREPCRSPLLREGHVCVIAQEVGGHGCTSDTDPSQCCVDHPQEEHIARYMGQPTPSSVLTPASPNSYWILPDEVIAFANSRNPPMPTPIQPWSALKPWMKVRRFLKFGALLSARIEVSTIWEGLSASKASKLLQNYSARVVDEAGKIWPVGLVFICPGCSKHHGLHKGCRIRGDNSGPLYCPICIINLCTRCHSRRAVPDNEGLCAPCAYEGVIREYRTNPMSIIRLKQPLNPKYIYEGIELEVECPPEHNHLKVAHEMKKCLKGTAITKHDGSLQNGFEICSIPLLLSEHRKRWEKIFKDPVWGLVDSREVDDIDDIEPNELRGVGLHVHFSRAPVSKLHLARFLHFWTRTGNREFITKLSGRKSHEYAKFGHHTYTKAVKKIHDAEAHIEMPEKYEAINLLHPNTIEVRSFQTTKQYPRFMSRLELVMAALDFSREYGHKDMTWPLFVDWTASQQGFKFLPLELSKLTPTLAKWKEKESKPGAWKSKVREFGYQMEFDGANACIVSMANSLPPGRQHCRDSRPGARCRCFRTLRSIQREIERQEERD